MLEALRLGMGRHQRRAFWEAIIAVCALVAAPHGKVSFATRVRIDHILDSLPDLKVFDANEFVDLFDRFIDDFQVSPRKARSRALDVIRKGASDSDEAELLARIGFAVADTETVAGDKDLEPLKSLCSELGVDLRSIMPAATVSLDEVPAEPITPHVTPPPPLESVEDTPEEEPEMQEEQPEERRPEVSAVPSSNGGAAEAAKPAIIPAAPASQAPAETASAADLSQQLLVDGTKAVIALCGRTKTGALEALRIYENEQLAAADRALSEKIANDTYWLSPVTLFPADGAPSDDEPAPIHVMCLSRPDGSVEALRAFENADQASADLEFFRNISNDKMWVSVVQFKTVT